MSTLVFSPFCAMRNVQCSRAPLRKNERKVQQPPARKYSAPDIVSGIRALAGAEGSCPTFPAKNNKSGWSANPKAAGKVRAMKVEKVGWQAMSGSALGDFGGAETPCDPLGMAGAVQPRAPRAKGALLPCAIPALRHRSFGTKRTATNASRIRCETNVLSRRSLRKCDSHFAGFLSCSGDLR